MILLDTHVWIWWVNNDSQLSEPMRRRIHTGEHAGLGVSVISCWEVANLVRVGRLDLTGHAMDWIRLALRYPGVRLVPLTPRIAVEANELPEPFHRDPADRILVATARVRRCPMLTADRKILDYPHIMLVE